MSLTQVLVFLHILGAALWIGGGFVVNLLGLQARKAGTGLTWAAQSKWIGPRFGIPGSVLLIVTGLWLVGRSPAFDYEQAWIVIGVMLWLANVVLGAGYHTSEGKRLGKAVATDGPESPGARKSLDRLYYAGWLQLVLGVVVVAIMIAKPGLG